VVGVGGVSATGALELLLRGAVLAGHVPAGGAGAGGIAGVHRDQLATGAFSLVREDAQEHPPTRVVDASVQPGLGRRAIGQETAGRLGVFVQGRSHWVLMYLSTVSALTAPTEATKNDDDHNVGI
jgi:hypothetical protein